MTIDVAKRVLDDFDAAISKRATEAYPNLTSAQAYAKFITSAEGSPMYKAAARSRLSVQQAAQDFPAPKSFGPAGAELNRLAIEMGRAKSLSMQESFRQMLGDPTHAELIRRSRDEEKRATEAVTRQRWPMRTGLREDKSRDWARGRR